MNFSHTYRFIAALITLSVLLGVFVPTGLHAMSPEECAEMSMMHHNHSTEDSPMPMMHADECPMEKMPSAMEHHNKEGLGIDCTCSLNQLPVKTEAPALQKLKLPVLGWLQSTVEFQSAEYQNVSAPLPQPESFSPPPAYIAFSSFLN